MNEERNNQPQAAEPSLSEILQVRRDKLKALQDAGRNPFEQTRFARSAYSADIKEDFEAYDGKTLQAAGRIMSKRGMGHSGRPRADPALRPQGRRVRAGVCRFPQV